MTSSLIPNRSPTTVSPVMLKGPTAASSRCNYSPSLHNFEDAEPRNEDSLADFSPSEPGAVSPAKPNTTCVIASSTQARTVPDEAFIARDRVICRNKTSHREGRNPLVEYRRDDDSELGLAAASHRVDCPPLSKTGVYLTNPDHVLQVKGQMHSDATLWLKLPHSESQIKSRSHGSQHKARLKQRAAKLKNMPPLALEVAAEKLAENIHVTFECPSCCDVCKDPSWIEFEERANLRRVSFQSSAASANGTTPPASNDCTISTSSVRALQLLGQCQCPREHPHARLHSFI